MHAFIRVNASMTIPVWVLLAFAGWTVVTLMVTVGSFRWMRIVTRRSEIGELQADRVEETGSDFYRRAMRAHANCVENLPVYGAIVLVLVVTGIDQPTLDALALALIGARIVHTTVHVSLVQTNTVTAVRFGFFFVQLVCMGWMGIHIAAVALS